MTTVVVQSLELGDLEPYASVFLPAASFLERDGHVSDWEGRSQRVQPAAAVRRDQPSRLGDLRRARGRLRRRPRVRHARGAARGDGAAVGAAIARGRRRRASRRRRRAAAGGLTLYTYHAAGRRGPAVRGRRRPEGGPGGPGVRRDAPERRERARPRRWPRRARCARQPARPSCRCASPSTSRPATVFVPFNQPGLAANTLLSGAFTTAVEVEPVDAVERASRRSSGGRLVTWIDWGDPARQGRDRVRRAAWSRSCCSSGWSAR